MKVLITVASIFNVNGFWSEGFVLKFIFMLFLMIRIIQLYIHWVGNCHTITGICVQQVYDKHNIGKMAQPN